MKIIYKKAESLEYPILVDTDSSPGTVYVRRNVEEFKNPDGLTAYRYDEAALNLQEYAEYQTEIENTESLSMQIITQAFEDIAIAAAEESIAEQEGREEIGQMISDLELLILEGQGDKEAENTTEE